MPRGNSRKPVFEEALQVEAPATLEQAVLQGVNQRIDQAIDKAISDYTYHVIGEALESADAKIRIKGEELMRDVTESLKRRYAYKIEDNKLIIEISMK